MASDFLRMPRTYQPSVST